MIIFFNKLFICFDQLQQQQSQTRSRHSGSVGHGIDCNDVSLPGDQHNSHSNLGRYSSQCRNRLAGTSPSSSSPQPPLISMPPLPAHCFYAPYSNNVNLDFQPFQHSSPVGSFMPSPTGTLNNQVPPGNRANNYWDNFRR